MDQIGVCPHPPLVPPGHSMPVSSKLSLHPSVTGVGLILFSVKYDVTFHPPLMSVVLWSRIDMRPLSNDMKFFEIEAMGEISH